MARSPIAQILKEIASIAFEADARQVCVAQVSEDRQHRALTRREFAIQGAKLGLGVIAGIAAFDTRVWGAAKPAARVVIIGAGLAGLTCGFRLKQLGIRATIYEAATRLGGRCYSQRGYFDDGQIAERGGEFIDTRHREIRSLARELGLTLDDLLKAEAPGTSPLFYFDGSPYTVAEATRDFFQIVGKLKKDLKEADYPTLYNGYTKRGFELDHLSIVDYINETVPGGIHSKLGQLLDVAYTIEYGAESSEQSALNLLYLLGYSSRTEFQIFGESDERFRIRGGNDQLVSVMAAELSNQTETGNELVAVRSNSDGTICLTLQSSGRSREITADQVVFALPFSIMRRSVDFARAGFSMLKTTAIQELGMGTNSKLQLQFGTRQWRFLGCNGETYADTGYQCTWEGSRAQGGASGILVNFAGGKIGASYNQGSLSNRSRRFLGQLEPVLPGITAHWNRKAILDYWTGYRWTRGSYSFWKVGQYTKFSGIEGAQEGNYHFAGEHTSTDYQGYLNGAVESGERAAREIMSDLTGRVLSHRAVVTPDIG